MPKNIYLGSSIYHLLVAAKKITMETKEMQNSWLIFLDSLYFIEKTKNNIVVEWDISGKNGTMELDFTDAQFYKKGNKIDKNQIYIQNNEIFSKNASILKNTFTGVIDD